MDYSLIWRTLGLDFAMRRNVTRQQKGEGFPGQQIVVLPKWVVRNSRQHPLLRDLMPTDIGYFPQASGHLRERTVGVNQAIFIFCARGFGWCELGGKTHSVKPGELLIIPPGASHAYGADAEKPWSIFWAHATGASLRLLLEELGITKETPLFFFGQDPELVALFEETIGILEHGYTTSHLLYASRTLAHLIGLMIWHRQQKWQGASEPKQKMAQSIAYMKAHLDQPLKVPELASAVNLSASHFSTLFKRQTGCAPMDYFIRLRLHHACQLLDNTDLSVKEVAASLGYEDPFYFSRIFKALNELSPTEYRNLHKG